MFCTDKGIADKIIPAETSESNQEIDSLLIFQVPHWRKRPSEWAFFCIRVEGLASDVPKVMLFVRAVYIVLKRRMSGKLHMCSLIF